MVKLACTFNHRSLNDEWHLCNGRYSPIIFVIFSVYPRRMPPLTQVLEEMTMIANARSDSDLLLDDSSRDHDFSAFDTASFNNLFLSPQPAYIYRRPIKLVSLILLLLFLMQALQTRNRVEACTQTQSLAAVHTLLRAGLGAISFLRFSYLLKICLYAHPSFQKFTPRG